MAEYIEREALKSELQESYNDLLKIYHGLKYDEEKRICAGQVSTFLECILRVKDAPAADAGHTESERCPPRPKGKTAFLSLPFCQNNTFYIKNLRRDLANSRKICYDNTWILFRYF